jgi:hypothetical protein
MGGAKIICLEKTHKEKELTGGGMDYQMHRSNCVHEYQCRKLNEFVFGIINTQKAGFFQKHKTKEDKKKSAKSNGGFYQKQKMAGNFIKSTILPQIAPINAQSALLLTP